jgi:GMP synthase (glutamine-hydrolysing)
VRPFLLLSIRAEDAAADNEYAAFLSLAGLAEESLHRVRLECGALGDVDLGEWSGIFVGGGPFNFSDQDAAKSPVQRRVEQDLRRLLDVLVAVDFPFLGACYGMGALGTHQGAVIDRQHGEPTSCVRVDLTAPGLSDPLFGGLAASFDAFTGHKEALRKVPSHVAVLASSTACPVQAIRVGRNVYATQFHPELDAEGMCTRIDVYKHCGYFDPAESENLKAMSWRSEIIYPPLLLRGFVARYASASVGAPAAACAG